MSKIVAYISLKLDYVILSTALYRNDTDALYCVIVFRISSPQTNILANIILYQPGIQFQSTYFEKIGL